MAFRISSSTTSDADAISVHVATISKAADGGLTLATVPVYGPGASLAPGRTADADGMPEAAELETLRYQLAERLPLGVEAVSVTHPRAVRSHDSARMQLLVGTTFHNVTRHGKWLALDTGRHQLAIHLRMSGRLHLLDQAAPVELHTHVVLDVTSQDEEQLSLRFIDPRTFGEVRLLTSGTTCWPESPDVLSAPTREELDEKHRRSSRPIKTLLLDQTAVVAGVGNYLADEICHAANIRPSRPAQRLTHAEWDAVLAAIRDRVQAHAALRGTALADEGWKDLYGQLGQAADELHVHGRHQCSSCGGEVTRTKLAGRSTYYCQRCQH